MKLVCQSQRCDSTPPKKASPKTFQTHSNSAKLTGDVDNNTASPKLHNPKSKIQNSNHPSLPSSTKSATLNKKLSTLLDRVLESTTDGVIISNQNGEIILINSSVRKMLGVSLASLPVPARQTGDLSSETSPQPNKSEGISDDVSTLNDLKASLSVVMVGSKIHLTEVVSSRDDEDLSELYALRAGSLSDIIRRAHERLDVICEVPGSPPLRAVCSTSRKPQVSQFKTGEERVIISVSFPLKDAEGETICIVTVLRDMDEVRQLNRLKTEVFLKISHELRTPLTVIKGSVDNLLQGVGGKLTRKQESYLSQTRDSAEKLIQQIEKLLATN